MQDQYRFWVLNLHKGPYIKDVRKIFGILDLVRIFTRSIRVNPRNLPYYVSFWATALPPPGADVLYVRPQNMTKERVVAWIWF